MAIPPFGAPPAKSRVRKNSAGTTFVRKRLNFIQGSNVTLTITDDAVDDEVDITIAAVAGGAGSEPSISDWFF